MVEEICLTAAPGLSVVINWNARLKYARSSLLSSLLPPTARRFALHHLYFGVSKFPLRFFSRDPPCFYLCSSLEKKRRIGGLEPERTRFRFTLSPERGLFLGLLGTVSSLGLVSMAQ